MRRQALDGFDCSRRALCATERGAHDILRHAVRPPAVAMTGSPFHPPRGTTKKGARFTPGALQRDKSFASVEQGFVRLGCLEVQRVRLSVVGALQSWNSNSEQRLDRSTIQRKLIDAFALHDCCNRGAGR